MAGERGNADHRVVTAYLDDVDLELDAVRRLVADPPSRFAAFHLQQAAEKLIKAIRLTRGLRITAEHNLEVLVAELSRDDTWRQRLAILEPLSAYATSFRYPSSAGKRKEGLGNDEVLLWITTIAELSAEARAFIAGGGTT